MEQREQSDAGISSAESRHQSMKSKGTGDYDKNHAGDTLHRGVGDAHHILLFAMLIEFAQEEVEGFEAGQH